MTPLDPTTVSSVITAVLVLIAPGLVVGLGLRLRGLALMAFCGPLSIAVVGIGGVAGDLIGIRFGWWTAAVVAGIAGVSARLSTRRRPPPAWARGTWREAAAVGAASLLALVLIGVIAFRSTPIDAISQTYDAVFHLNAAASIIDTGRASSFELYRLTSPDSGTVNFYPAAWHSLVALTVEISGASIPLATGAVWLAVAGAVWAPGAALLTRAVLGRRSVRGGAILLPILLSACFAAFPYSLLSWGTLYPTALATALIPSGLGLLWFAVRSSRAAFADGIRPSLRGSGYALALLAAWTVAGVFAHPRTLITFVVLALPLLARAILIAARGLREHGRARASVAVIAIPGAMLVVGLIAAAAVLIRSYNLIEEPISERLTGGPATARQSIWASLVQVVTAAPVSAPGDVPLPPSVPLAITVIVGLALALVSRRIRPLASGFLAVALLYILAAGSNDDIAKILTAAWYKDKYRLISVLPAISIPLVVLAVMRVGDLASRRSDRFRRGARTLLAAAVVIPSILGPTLAGASSQIARTFELPASTKAGRLIDAQEQALLEAAADIVPAGQRVLGNPWDGSALVWALGGREAVFPHFIGRWGDDRDVIATRLDEVVSDPAICGSLDRLRVRYVISDTERLWNGNDPQINYFAGIDRAVASGQLTLVSSEGSAALYRIDSCGPLD